ncbi:hypothetical protein [Sporosalibacterium faouarense]|uniref:hypothetical protein n=1 Tax=Sporosalibacterium faouarense TaxID=516123 RepID=UPI00192B87DC|nr:hypothetical protein [Sporosalibacterium faouarense]
MTDYYINLDFQGQKRPNEKLKDVIENIQYDDELIVNVAADNHRKIEGATRFLDNNGFDHLNKGINSGNQISIVAHLKKE